MESKLPKLNNFKKASSIPKTILPMERFKSNIHPGTTNRVPLTRDVSNFATIPARGRRFGSPEFPTKLVKSKLRRSRSVGDLCDVEKRGIKRFATTQAPLPAKLGKLNSETSAAAKTCASVSKPLAATKSFASKLSATNKANAPVTKTNKKIPAYDYKARFNDLLEKHNQLKEKFECTKEQLASLDSLSEQYEECQNEQYKVKEELKASKSQIECLERLNNSQTIKNASLTKYLQETKEELDKLQEQYALISKEHAEAMKKNEEMMAELSELRNTSTLLSEQFQETKIELTECKEQLFAANIERKYLHNMVMDLRGNIRVFCRVRPPLNCEEGKILCGWNYLDENTLEIQNLDLSSGGKHKVANHTFSFDHVFHPQSTQEEVFEMVSPLIQSALDGYNICIFAYGQTGSGKTYTMDGIPEQLGVIPRTVDLLFESVKNYKRLGWEYEIKATFLEIYNEVLYDLLSNEVKDMDIKMGKTKTDIYVSNITEEIVRGASHLRQLMHIAKMNRATAATSGNERSSRSHAVTRIELIGRHEQKGEISLGSINLVDLAGSESPKTSTRMNETKSINRSLSELTNVILALLQKQEHVPYRNSKLTHLLMPCLGGNSKTLMFINVAPFQDCFVESVKSLRFAALVNSCKVSKVRRNKFLNTSSSSSV